jgi:hypothetical protein
MKAPLFALAGLAASCCAFDAYRAPEVPPYGATLVALDRTAPPQWPGSESARAAEPAGADALLGVWQTNVPGAVYVHPPSGPGYGVLNVSSGAAAGLLRLAPEGSYSWNLGSRGGKQGRWVSTGQIDYPIQLLDPGENRHWSVGLDRSTGELIVRSGSTSYRGRRAAVRQAPG